MTLFDRLKAENAQNEFYKLESSCRRKQKYRLIAAVDVAFNYMKNYGIGVAVTYDIENGEILECGVVKLPIMLPYIPGFLGFRETPFYVASLKLLKSKPDLILVDGHGRAHYRLAGSATQLGLAIRIPTIGVAKKILVKDSVDDEGNIYYKEMIVGRILDEPKGAKPLYISSGCGVSIEEAYVIVKNLRKNKGLPIPLNYADKISKRYARYGP